MHTPAKIDFHPIPTPSIGLAPNRAGSKNSAPRIVLPAQETNIDAARSFMHDYLVPILAKEFLRLRDSAQHEPITVKANKRTSKPFGKEGGL